MTKEELNKKLQELISGAASHDGHIRRSEVEDTFSKDHFSGEQIDMICEFLLSRKIIVDDYLQKEQREPDGAAEENVQGPDIPDDQKKWLAMYEDDLAEVRPAQPGEWEQLVEKLRHGDADAKRRVAEIFLPEVLKIAREMYQPGMILQDMIQEGNLQLVLWADQLALPSDTGEEAARRALDRELREGMQAFLASQREVHARDTKLVQKAEDFHDGVEILKNEYGRKVYLDEAADFMNMSEEEAEAILRLTGDRVPDDTEDTGGTDGGHASSAEKQSGGR